MNFDILYSIALDLIKKKNTEIINDTDCVCVLITQNNSIFTGVNSVTIKHGKLVSLCAEYETIKIMLNSNESKIKALVVVNYKTLLPCIPCDDCKKLILEVNSENVNTLIMQPDKSFVKLSVLLNNPKSTESFDQSIWESGWDDDDNTIPSNTNNQVSSINNYNSFNNSMEFNPMPQSNINRNNSTSYIYQPNSGFINSSTNSSVYMESINSISVSTLQTSTVNKSNSTFVQQKPVIENNRFKENLKNIMSTKDILSNISTDSTSQNLNDIPKPKTDKYIPSKKELKALAKEKKRQAKKNIKIMQDIEKHNLS